MSKLQEITSCEVCGSTELAPVLNLGAHPLCDDLVAIGDTRRCREFPIEILFCAACVTAHQRYQVPKRELFPTTYHYRSRFTADVLKGMSALTESCERRLGTLVNKFVVDVGCNDGSLLDFFRQKGARTVGVEPTDACKDAQVKGHEILNGFFSPETATHLKRTHGSPDVITFTNVFAHIENLGELIEALLILMGPSTLLVIENHYLGAVLERFQFDTFYHEHPRTYSFTSFQRIASRLNRKLSLVEFPSRYGGNIRVFVGGPEVGNSIEPIVTERIANAERDMGSQLSRMQAGVERWKSEMRPRLEGLASEHGPLPAKAFPGRAAILVKLLGLDVDLISAAYEKPGSMKIGHYIPGTRVPIRSDDEFVNDTPVVVNLAWHISNEIQTYLRSRGFAGEIVDIFDFARVRS